MNLARRVHRQFIGGVIVTDMLEGRGKQATGEKEARKRTWRRGPQDQTHQTRTWTLKPLGGKTVWDWLQLLIVPLVLVGIGLLFEMQQADRQQAMEEQQQALEERRAEAERELAEQRAQDEALQAYLDQMSSLLLEKDLRASGEESEVRTLARARTLTVLERLDPSRKTAVMQFLVLQCHFTLPGSVASVLGTLQRSLIVFATH
jgi:hypothetical protein